MLNNLSDERLNKRFIKNLLKLLFKKEKVS